MVLGKQDFCFIQSVYLPFILLSILKQKKSILKKSSPLHSGPEIVCTKEETGPGMKVTEVMETNQNDKNPSRHIGNSIQTDPHQGILLPKTLDVLSFCFTGEVVFLINAF